MFHVVYFLVVLNPGFSLKVIRKSVVVVVRTTRKSTTLVSGVDKTSSGSSHSPEGVGGSGNRRVDLVGLLLSTK